MQHWLQLRHDRSDLWTGIAIVRVTYDTLFRHHKLPICIMHNSAKPVKVMVYCKRGNFRAVQEQFFKW